MNSKKVRLLLPYCALLLMGILTYARALTFDYTYYDDQTLILQNLPFLQNLNNLPQTFKQHAFAAENQGAIYYRPLLIISLMLDAQWTGALPTGYHVTNIVLHLTAVCLVYFLTQKLKYRQSLGFLAAAILATHPAISQAVGWIPGRNDTLLSVFFLGSLITLLEWIKTKRPNYLTSHILLYAAAIFTKETALALPILATLYLTQNTTPTSPKQLKTLFPGWAIVTGIWLYLRHTALTNPPVISLTDRLSALPQHAAALLVYIGKVLFPTNLSGIPVLPDSSLLPGLIALALFIYLTITTKNRRTLIWPIAWFTLTLLPSLVPVEPKSQPVFLEHRLYLPIIGLLLFLGKTKSIEAFDSKNRLHQLAAGIMIITLSLLTINHIGIFAGPFTFYQSAVASSPSSATAHANLGSISYNIRGDIALAEKEYTQALTLDPNIPYIHNNLGLIYLEQNRLTEAEQAFVTELNHGPYADALYNLGQVYLKQDKQQDALNLFHQTLIADQNHPGANISLARYYYDSGEDDKARHYYAVAERYGLILNFAKPPKDRVSP